MNQKTKNTTTKNIFNMLGIVLLAAFLLGVALQPVSAAGIVGKSISINLINQEPDPAIAGNIVEVRLGIENNGSTSAKDMVIELQPSYPFQLVSGEDAVQNIGTIRPYQNGADLKIIKYKLRIDRDARQGSYSLDILEYEKGKRNEARSKRKVIVDVKNKESAEVIYIDRVELIPGKQTSLQFTINNVGSAPLRDLTFSWENEDGAILPVGSDDTKYIKYVEVGEQAEIAYDVIADSNAEPGLYKLLLNLKYAESSGGEKEIRTTAGVYVGGATDFEVAYAESAKGETSFSIANIGSNPSYSVAISIPKQENWAIKGSNSVIIGNLNKGDYTVAGFKLQPMVKNDQELPLLIQVAYTDTTGKREVVEKTLDLVADKDFGMSELDVAQTLEASGGFGTGKIFLVVLVLGVIYWYTRQRKKKGVKK